MDLHDSDTLFDQAVKHHQSGRFAEAVVLYDASVASDPQRTSAHFNRGTALLSLGKADEALLSFDRVLELEPDDADAHYLKAVLLVRLDRLEEALESYRRATALKPEFADAWFEQGDVLRRLNRIEEAISSYDRATAIKPDFAEAYNDKGNLLRALKRLDEARECFDRLVVLKPDMAVAHNNRGTVLGDLERFVEALQSYDRAIELSSDYAEAYNNKGNALRIFNQPENALWCYDRAIEFKPDFAEAYGNRGAVLNQLSRHSEALQSYDRAIELKPDFAEAYNNKANVLDRLNRPHDAFRCHDRALEINPNYVDAHCFKGNTFCSLRRMDEAIHCYDRAIALNPDYADAYWSKSRCKLMIGDFEEGWPLYEWRKKRPGFTKIYHRSQPCWSGNESLEGANLLIYAEQGLGDTIQFCRYALLAEQKGARVTLAVQDALVRLLGSLSPATAIEKLSAVSGTFDYQIALMSMPQAFGTTLSTCPAKVPYLRAEPEKVQMWKSRLGSHGFKVGIGWQGNKRAEIDFGRSFPLRHFEGISKLPNIRLISLQRSEGIEQLGSLPSGMKVETLGEDFDRGPDAFVDTAAVMDCLDLVITSDTAMAHLAGALGRPTWVALKCVPEWRWLLDRADSPWYPTLKLFRQPEPGDWSSVFAAIEAQLRARDG